MKATVAKRGQVSIPARLRREMRLGAGRTVLWEKASDTECRLTAVPQETNASGPTTALGFARQHGLEEGYADDCLKELRAGEEENDGEEAS